MTRADSYQRAVARWKRLERAASLPVLCDYCDKCLRRDDEISIIEREGRMPLAMHSDCAERSGRTRSAARRER